MNEFSGISTATLQSWLSDAQTAMQQLAIGKKTVSIGTSDGKRISFTPSELPELRKYILRLQTAISIATGATTGQPYSVATWTR
ncbi:MAG: hypothetical protein IPK63_18820 [Candidatus Competibacteraceae bacterium]|nr:hypothetical protein [Candidatus Competibacteraceae bacterium]